jgi:hypothetical protein
LLNAVTEHYQAARGASAELVHTVSRTAGANLRYSALVDGQAVRQVARRCELGFRAVAG